MSPFSQEHDGSTYTQCDTSNVLSDIDDTVGSRVQYPQFKAQGVGREQSQQRSEENEDDKQEKAGFTSTRSEPAHSPPDPPQDSQTNLAEQIAQLSVAIESLTSHLKEESEARKGGRTSDPAIPGQRLMLQPLYDYDVETLRALMSVNKQVAYEEFRKYFINYVIQTVVLGANERRPPEEFPDLYLCHSKDASSLTSNEEEAPEVFDFQNEGLPHFSSSGKYVDLAKALGRLFPHWSARGFTWLDELSLNKTTAAESAESGSNGFISYLALRQASLTLSFHQIACIACWLLNELQLPEELQDRSLELSTLPSAVMEFICYFCRPFHDSSRFIHTEGPWNVHHDRSVAAQLYFSMRSLAEFSGAGTDASSRESGLHIDREDGNLVLDPSSKIRECRMAILCLARYPVSRGWAPYTDRPKVTRFNTLGLSDFFYHGAVPISMASLTQRKVSDYNMGSCSEVWEPVVFFIACFMAILPDWHKSWISFLDVLDSNGTQTISVRRLLHHEQLREMLFDSSPAHAESHFQILNLLRLAGYWIRQTQEDWRKLRVQTMVCQHGDFGRVEEFWRASESELLDYSKSILERIEKKTEETKGLRDGFYSANALREAAKGTQVNEYLFVFTLMTILYLPLTFVATLYGNSIDFFDFTDPSQQAAFGSAMGAVSLATYIVSFSIIWVLRSRSRRQSARRFWTAIITKFDATRLWHVDASVKRQSPGKQSPRSGYRLQGLGESLRFRGRKSKGNCQDGPSEPEV